MSLESRIEAGGRRVLRSPLWTGLAVTLFFVLPTVIIPGIPLWVSAVVALMIGPPAVFTLYLIYELYARLFGSDKPNDEGADETADTEATDTTPLDRLKQQYADGEIDEETFERRLDRLMETGDPGPRVDGHDQSVDELTLWNR